LYIRVLERIDESLKGVDFLFFPLAFLCCIGGLRRAERRSLASSGADRQGGEKSRKQNPLLLRFPIGEQCAYSSGENASNW